MGWRSRIKAIAHCSHNIAGLPSQLLAGLCGYMEFYLGVCILASHHTLVFSKARQKGWGVHCAHYIFIVFVRTLLSLTRHVGFSKAPWFCCTFLSLVKRIVAFSMTLVTFSMTFIALAHFALQNIDCIQRYLLG